MNEIAARIAKAMEQQNISYGELARLTGIPKSAVFRYVTGKTEKMPLPRLELIAKALHIEAAYLMGWEDEDGNIPGLVVEPVEKWTEMDMRLLKWFRSLPQEKQRAILIAQDAPEDLV